MLLILPGILNAHELAQFRTHLDSASWQDGRVTAGSLSAAVKQNEQLPEEQEPAISLGNHVLRTLGEHSRFLSAALPESIYPPKFNRYSGQGRGGENRNGGDYYGAHVDAAVMTIKETRRSLRSDLSATLFLSEPQEYDGGELCIATEHGMQAIKLPAGDMVLYPSGSVHLVKPVTRGTRLASFFWIQSMVQDKGERELLYELDGSIQALAAGRAADDPELIRLTGIYHNLLRRWAQV
ncbi:MAG: Fe2+-dependent dioxygenase [Pseudomonadota bacterium]